MHFRAAPPPSASLAIICQNGKTGHLNPDQPSLQEQPNLYDMSCDHDFETSEMKNDSRSTNDNLRFDTWSITWSLIDSLVLELHIFTYFTWAAMFASKIGYYGNFVKKIWKISKLGKKSQKSQKNVWDFLNEKKIPNFQNFMKKIPKIGILGGKNPKWQHCLCYVIRLESNKS